MISRKTENQIWQDWQDSGVNSGASTPMCDIKDEKMIDAPNSIEFDWEENNLVSLTDNQLFVSSREYFDDDVKANIDMPPELTDSGQNGNIQSCMVKNCDTPSNYQNDVDVANRALPELINLLSDDDPLVVYRSAGILHQITKNDSSRWAIMNSPLTDRVVAASIQAIARSDNSEIIRYSAGALYSFSLHERGLYCLYTMGGIPELVKLLASSVDEVVFYAIATIHNLLLYQEGSKSAVQEAGGLEKIITLLSRNNYKFLTILAHCLTILAFSNQEAKLIILAHRGTQQLVRIMEAFQFNKLLLFTSRALKCLSVCSSNKKAMIEAGAIQALGKHLQNLDDPMLLTTCLATLRNLSNAAANQRNLEALLQSLVRLMNANDLNIVTCAVGIISNLTCNNQINKQIVCQLGGVEPLVRIIRTVEHQSRPYDDVIETSVCALRHLTCRHEGAEMAQNCVRVNEGLPVLINLLNSSRHWPLLKAVVGLLRNLALCRANLTSFRDHEIIPKLIHLLHESMDSQVQVKSQVKMENIIEEVIGTLRLLGKDAHNREIIRRLNPTVRLMPILLELLYSGNEKLQQVSLGLLTELSRDKENMEMLRAEHISNLLIELQHSLNPAVASSATFILLAISQEKNDDKKQIDLHDAFFQVDNWSNSSSLMDMNLPTSDDSFGEQLCSESWIW